MKKIDLLIVIIVLLFLQAGCKKDMKRIESKIGNEQYVGEKIRKTDAQWREKLTPEQYHIVREKGTERPFTGEYNDFYEEGNYYCVACDLLLFDSESKFKSGCGWPSFSDLTTEKNINFFEDNSANMQRIEVRCARCDAHLGHIFNDGPPPTYLRYCINSLSIQFKKEK